MSEQSDQLEKFYQLVETIVVETRGWIPWDGDLGPQHSSNERLSPEARTKLAFLEDMLHRAASYCGKAEDVEAGFPPLRNKIEIQRAHDIFFAIVNREVPNPFGREDHVQTLIMNSLGVLCWALNHDHGPMGGFQQNLTDAQIWLADRGYVAGVDIERAKKENNA